MSSEKETERGRGCVQESERKGKKETMQDTFIRNSWANDTAVATAGGQEHCLWSTKKERRTKRFRFFRYLRLRLRYAFHTQFHPGVCRPPAAKKTTV